ncbi:DUF389 domain-containing protein [Qipengyuania sp. JC766]|uniref:DUF389 domain-containing protein n=1 Tax=Qipengyuania sp. JC766 TaxID=3232139 RepID=UPI00345A8809
MISIPQDHADRARTLVRECGASLFADLASRVDERDCRLLVLEVPNGRVEDIFARLEEVEPLRASFIPQGIMSLRPPADEAEQAMTDIQPRSPLEIFLGGLQSIGSWTGFLGYSAVAGVIVWVGLFTESVFLLVAAMLIAPFAGPAMTAALATARGDRRLLGRSLVRYVGALGTSIVIAFALSMVFDQQIATGLMVQTSQRSTVSFLLPLAAGVAGALNLAQSERSSLVSGAATGMLIAAALAPPAGLVGMGLAIGQTDLVISSLWALAIQIVGINLAGFAVFRLHGMKTEGARYPRGRPGLSLLSLAVSIGALAALLALQFAEVPQYQQSSIAQRISAAVKDDLSGRGGVTLVSVDSQFSRARPQGQNPVWVTLHLHGDLSEGAREDLARELSRKVEREFGVEALIEITALP